MSELLTKMIRSQYHIEENGKLEARDDLVRAIALADHNKRKDDVAA